MSEGDAVTNLVIYPGTFDPMTLGHLDLVERGSEMFERLLIAVAVDSPKTTLFTVEERVAMAREVVGCLPNVEVDPFRGLLVDYARERGARVLLRGLRAYSDFESEFQMALINRKLAPEIETLFMMPKETHSYLSSNAVKQVAGLGGNVGEFVPPAVARMLRLKLGAGETAS
ncbi:pantetheine-phosphate adenylyltransferase [Verrucomicrobiota bacterium]